MMDRHNGAWRRIARRVVVAAVLSTAALGVMSAPASAATTATFSSGILRVFGDSADNSIVISRDAGGTILVNGGAVTVTGGPATVANTARIEAFGVAGGDVIILNEAAGALPAAILYGGGGHDALTGGSGADQLHGQVGNDTLRGKGGSDRLFGSSENDTITGGDANDQAFGQGGNDRMVWSPGDDTDLNEGGADTDTVEVNGSSGGEQFTTTANGVRVRFDRLNPAPFSLDIGSTENLLVNANGGADSSSATGNLAALIRITVDGGAGQDTLLGSNGIDLLLGGDDNDFVDGQQGNDVAFLGAHDDTFQWDPGDGSDIIEGQDGTDGMVFNGSGGAENLQASANQSRVLFTRDVGAIVMDLDDVEGIVVRAFGNTDNVTINDLSGTDLVDVDVDLFAPGGFDDALADNVIVNGTGDDDVVTITGAGTDAQVAGLPAVVSVTGASAATDRLTVNGLDGGDVLDASGVPSGSVLLTLDGGALDDAVIGGDGNDTLLGGDGDDVLIGGPGTDTIDGGTGDNVVIDEPGGAAVTSASPAGEKWLATHTEVVGRNTLLDVGGEERTLPRAQLSQLARGVTSG